MEAWILDFLAGGGLETKALRRAQEDFSEAAAEGSYKHAKTVLLALLMTAREKRPETVEALFDNFAPVLRARVDELPAHERQRELQDLKEGRIRLPVSVAEMNSPTLGPNQARQTHTTSYHASFKAQTFPEAEAQKSGQSPLDLFSAQVVSQVDAIPKNAPIANLPQWGAFLGRLMGKASAPEQTQILDKLLSAGRFDQTLFDALMVGTSETDIQPASLKRIVAALRLAKVASGILPADNLDKEALEVVGQSALGHDTRYVPVQSTADGIVEHVTYKLLKQQCPELAEAVLDHHPHLYDLEDTPAYGELVDELAAELGPFLKDYNLGAVMHHVGQALPFMEGLTSKLGLNPKCYVGVDVPYSGSPLVHDALRRKGLKTSTEHDPRAGVAGHLIDWATGPKSQFDDLKEEEIKRNVEELLALHQQNGKPILVIDDGGYVSKVVRKDFADKEHLFRIVEWTTRGINLYRTITNPQSILLSGAGSRPKVEIEPAFIGDSCTENTLVQIKERFGEDLKGLKLLLVGNGNIGAATAQSVEKLGAKISVYDRDPKALRRAGQKAAKSLAGAIPDKNVILMATGAHSMPPELASLADPDTLFISLSSVDIETRSKNPRMNGNWEVGLSRITLRVGPDVKFDEKAWKKRLARCHPLNRQRLIYMRQTYERTYAARGLKIAFDFQDHARGGFPVNLTGCLQTMDIARQEVPLMNVAQALAELCDPQNHSLKKGENKMRETSEERILRIYQKHHSEHYQRALSFKK